jgi:hypothetical protein
VAASAGTVKDVLAIVRKYVSDDVKMRAMLIELARVAGNQSFQTTVLSLRQEFERQVNLAKGSPSSRG